MRRFAFDAAGTGFSRQAASALINQPPADQYIQGLGDEIMLLEGLEYPVGYDTGRAAAFSPPWNGQSDYDFGVDGFSLKGFSLSDGGLRQAPGYRFVGLSGGLGGMSARDCATATSIATSVKGVCEAACSAAHSPTDQQLCRAGCATAYNAAMIPINMECAGGGSTTGTTDPATRAAIEAKLAQLEEQQRLAQSGQYAQMAATTGPNYVMIAGGVAAVGVIGLLAYFAMRNR
jgi:hypothetical protein